MLIEARGEVQFRSQHEDGLKKFVENTLGRQIEDPAFCWAACFDMALSRFIDNESERRFMLERPIKFLEKQMAFINRGAMEFDMVQWFVEVLDNNLIDNSPQRIEASYKEGFSAREMFNEVKKGNVLIFSIVLEDMGHMMVMDETDELTPDGLLDTVSIFDPKAKDQEGGRMNMNIFELYGIRNSLADSVVSIGKRSW